MVATAQAGAAGGSHAIAWIFAAELCAAVCAWLLWRFIPRRAALGVSLARFRRLGQLAGIASQSRPSVAAAVARAAAAAASSVDTRVLDRAPRLGAEMVQSLSMPVRLWQSGRARSYMLWSACGLILLLAFCLLQVAR